jgi:two-component system sensor histidine kinase QseC
MKPLSLRARLVLLTTLAVAVVWLVTAAFTWRSALNEIEELLDHPPATQQHLSKERRELAHEIAEHLLMPMLIALPGLALVLVVAIGISLRPLRRLAEDVATRSPDRLTPISAADVPREILPLVERLNALFGDVERALENERRFTADASHELRTPLAALKAQAQVALGATADAEREHALRQIVAGCDRATHLVAQMLTLARLDADIEHTRQELALRPLAEETLADLAGTAIAQGCELTLAEGDARVRGIPGLLRVVLGNLVDNALRHGQAGHITIAITHGGGRVMLTVADDGNGIPASDRDVVQQRFRRGTSADFSITDPPSVAPATRSAGSGLGLSIVRRIVELHDGTLGLADSEGGRGLTVRIDLPEVN